jgi:lipoprotein NlpI
LPVADGTDRREPHYLIGAMYYSMGRKADAKRVLAIARSKAPKSARIAAYLGMVQLSGGEAGAAEDSFQSALALDSGEALALIGMGGIRYRQQRWSDAIEYLEKSRTADPDALFLLCDAYYRVGKPEQAVLMAEVVRAFAAERKPLLDELEKLATLHQSDRPQMAP